MKVGLKSGCLREQKTTLGGRNKLPKGSLSIIHYFSKNSDILHCAFKSISNDFHALKGKWRGGRSKSPRKFIP